jgi:hypothetical protein
MLLVKEAPGCAWDEDDGDAGCSSRGAIAGRRLAESREEWPRLPCIWNRRARHQGWPRASLCVFGLVVEIFLTF